MFSLRFIYMTPQTLELVFERGILLHLCLNPSKWPANGIYGLRDYNRTG